MSPSPKPTANVPPPPLVALAGWVLPGAGYWLLGQRVRAITIGLTILALFVLGVLIGGIRVVDAPNPFAASGGGMLNRIAQKPWFVGQLFAGPVSLAGAYWSDQAGAPGSPHAGIRAHGRLADIATLYTAVAGMLNLLAIIDSAHRAGHAHADASMT